jgi:hypothetical protein
MCCKIEDLSEGWARVSLLGMGALDRTYVSICVDHSGIFYTNMALRHYRHLTLISYEKVVYTTPSIGKSILYD